MENANMENTNAISSVERVRKILVFVIVLMTVFAVTAQIKAAFGTVFSVIGGGSLGVLLVGLKIKFLSLAKTNPGFHKYVVVLAGLFSLVPLGLCISNYALESTPGIWPLVVSLGPLLLQFFVPVCLLLYAYAALRPPKPDGTQRNSE